MQKGFTMLADEKIDMRFVEREKSSAGFQTLFTARES